MEYIKTCEGRFINRPNRFIAAVDIDGKEEKAHVKNTGRLKELLVPGAEICLEDFQGRMGSRKMRYSLIGVKKGEVLINVDSQAPNKAVKEALENETVNLPGMGKLTMIKGEKSYGDSRLDFYVEDESGQKGYLEVKGVTLEEGGIARFPDAPTLRGIKHIEELIKIKNEGCHAYILFVIQMKPVTYFMPNDKTHPAFGEALRRADNSGVRLLAYDCQIGKKSMKLADSVQIKLK